MMADGAEKYRAGLDIPSEAPASYEVSVRDAASRMADYGEVVWTHAAFVPRQEGIKLIASSLGCAESKVRVARVREVQELLTTQEVPQGIKNIASESKSKLLLVCMVGGTSLRAAELLGAKGIRAESLTGGIAGLAEAGRKEPSELVQLAAD